MQQESGDDYIRRLATFIRSNERKLADGGGRRRKALSAPSLFNPLAWVGLADTTNEQQKPIVLSLDTHHLFYLLMRIEALGINVGSLDVQIDEPSRPLAYIHLDVNNDKSDTLSISSFRSSFSAVSKLSLGSAWWGKPEVPTVDNELKFIYKSFTYLPALSLHAPGPRVVTELSQDPLHNSAVPMDSFKMLRTLECFDVDPRALLGWDYLAESLRSLTIKRSGLDDPTSIFLDAVLDDQTRRSGESARSRSRFLGQRHPSSKFHASTVPETVREEPEGTPPEVDAVQPARPLSQFKWAFLKHLCLSDNALTTIPSGMLEVLTAVTHLDLSSNLLVSVPTLSALFNLVSLNLSDNMIDSVLGIYKKLGQVLTLNLSRNRLDLLSGLERLVALERVDLRHNMLTESAEVGRLSVLPNITEVWIEGNPFTEVEETYRVRCFDYFWREGKTITLDGTLPGYYERRGLTTLPPNQMYSSRSPAATFSPATAPLPAPLDSINNTSPRLDPKAFVQSPGLSPSQSGSSSLATSPGMAPITAKPKRRRNRRLVALDVGDSEYRSSEDGGVVGSNYSRAPSSSRGRDSSQPRRVLDDQPLDTPLSDEPGELRDPMVEPPTPTERPVMRRSRHSRSQTEAAVSPMSDFDASSPTADSRFETRKSSTLSRANKRRQRVAMSVYEPGSPKSMNVDESTNTSQLRDADAFRQKIEALREEMGDNWLQVLSQSQFRSDQHPPKG